MVRKWNGSPGQFTLGDPLKSMNDQIFDALANEHRRRLLLALLHENPQDAIVESLPRDGDAGDANPEQRHRIQMYHAHLPKLEDDGFIEWNEDTNEVTKGPQFDEIRPLLHFVDGDTKTTPDLTDSQRDLLWSAVDEGYFEVPREIALGDLAAEHGMSSQEASKRLRRGLNIVVRNAVDDEWVPTRR